MPTQAAAPDRPEPVAAVGDPAVAAEDRQPEERDEGQPDGQADERRADEPGARVDDGSRVVTTSPTRTQTTAAAREERRDWPAGRAPP